MNASSLTRLRDKKTGSSEFRFVASRLAHHLVQKTFPLLPLKEKTVETPFQKTKGYELKGRIILIPVLRSGIALLSVFLEYFPEASVGFMGLKRDEKTAIAHEYYRNLPPIGPHDTVIVLDPMIATGGTAVQVFQHLQNLGVKIQQMIFVALIAAPEGLQVVKKAFPKLRIVLEVVDKGLNKKKFIVPGIGDFGDRYFGTTG